MRARWDDFEATLELVRRIRFAGVFAFKYSVRPYTPAQRLADDVPEDEKATRLATLFALADAERQRRLEALVGTRASVLVEGRGRGSTFTGRTERNDIVHLEAAGDPTGSLVDVAIVRAFKNSLEGVPVKDGAVAKSGAKGQAAVAERRVLPLV